MNNSFEDIKMRPQKIQIDDKICLLEYDFNAYALLEELCGVSVFQLRDKVFEHSITFKDLLILLYCALLKHQPDFDIEKLKHTPHLGALLQQNLQQIYTAFFEPLLPPAIEEKIEFKGE